MGHLSLSVQAAMRASVIRCPPYRGTNVSRYAPTGQRPARYPDRRCGSSWPKNYPSPRLNHKFQLTHFQNIAQNKPITKTEQEETKQEDNSEKKQNDDINELKTVHHHENEKCETEQAESPKKESMDDNQSPSTSAATVDTGLRKKRLYSTVLSMSAPSPINLSPVVRLAQKLSTPGILKLNRKIILPSARIRPPNIEHKFEELEKEALEQYKASDESIDTKFHELEKQAVEQYSTSNSNTSCSSENSGGKKAADKNEKTRISSNSHKEKPVGSVVIYSQNFPDLNSKGASVTNLKNLHVPPRGEKKNHKSKVSRLKNDTQRAVSDTDNEVRGSNFSFKNDKSAMRWTLHVVPPKKRHLTLCVTDYSSDEEIEVSCRSIDAVPRIKNRAGLMKISAHGGGDLHPIMRKT